MARQSALSPAQWQQVRDLSVAGVSDADILREYGDSGLTLAALKKRRIREQWPSPSALAHKARQISVQIEASKRNVSNVPKGGDKDSKTLVLSVMQDRTLASFTSLNARACSAMDSAIVPDVETMRDLDMLTKIAERTARLDADKGRPSVQVNVAVGPWQRTSRTSERVIDMEDA